VVRASFLHTYIITVQVRLFNAWGTFSLSLHSLRMLRFAQTPFVLLFIFIKIAHYYFTFLFFRFIFHILSPLSLVAFYSQAISCGFVRIV
jgi:hypothetical protein